MSDVAAASKADDLERAAFTWKSLLAGRGGRDRKVSGGRFGVRARLLTIVLVPSLTLLGAGVGAAGYLILAGRDARQWAELASATLGPAVRMVQAFQEERRLSVLHIGGDESVAVYLTTARQRSDDALLKLRQQGIDAARMRADFATDISGYDKLYEQLPGLRAAVDRRVMAPQPVVAVFGSIIDVIMSATLLAGRAAPSSDVATELSKGLGPLRASEALSRAGALASVFDTLSVEHFVEFSNEVGELRAEMSFATGILAGPRLDQLNELLGGEDWRGVFAFQNELLGRGAKSTAADKPRGEATADETDALAAGMRIQTRLVALWEGQTRDAQDIAVRNSEATQRNSLLGGLAAMSIAILGFLVVLQLANRLIARMHRLRVQTLELADHHLPQAMRRVEADPPLRTDTQQQLDFGTDEIGQVADAFNRAHGAALAAVFAEAKLRAGVNSVFVNIAQRSQVIVHKQLEILDSAEQREESPDRLDLLFRLDHLATRARRNAENLIILGGGTPGRRWRKPVPLIDIARSAVAESVDYRRISVAKMPDVHLGGAMVADLIHILAELMDNATAFSPPESRVEVTGRIVGKGAVIEIVDQGLGIPDADVEMHNALLAQPPSFSLETLVEDGRLGLFVIATVAARHRISVRLRESPFGGICAIVLIPTQLMGIGAPEAATMGHGPHGVPGQASLSY
ncbi:nitrate- and nitrite sensing domain-containing protein [Nocardia sp. NPDC005978]|uniref:sensor histidine kinase n=1 Tax=Nocardia sp. NPDC005978 TaxID=3156725 RepID=UPI0033BCCDF2